MTGRLLLLIYHDVAETIGQFVVSAQEAQGIVHKHKLACSSVAVPLTYGPSGLGGLPACVSGPVVTGFSCVASCRIGTLANSIGDVMYRLCVVCLFVSRYLATRALARALKSTDLPLTPPLERGWSCNRPAGV